MRPILAALLILSLTAPSARAQVSADSARVLLAKGKSLYHGKGLCVTCHGADGEGVLGPTTRLTAEKAWLHIKGSQAEVVALIKTGVPAEQSKSASVMPPKGGSRLTDAEIELVAMYVRDLHEKKGPGTP